MVKVFANKIVSKSDHLRFKDFPEERLREFFKSFDKDGDGKLSRSEMKAAFKELGSRFPAFRAWRAIAKVDNNGDGFIDLNGKELHDLIEYAITLDF